MINQDNSIKNINVLLSNKKYNHILPEGMKVVECRSIILKIKADNILRQLSFNCKFRGIRPYISGCNSGEGLECKEWENDNYVVSVGTEDIDYLKKRYSDKSLYKKDKYPIDIHKNNITISLNSIPKDFTVSLHYLIAWAKLPEKLAPSTWFAVDRDHKYLLDDLYE